MTNINSPTEALVEDDEGSPCSAGASPNVMTSSQSMALNVAYEAVEKVRHANVEIEFGECHPSQCIICLREERNSQLGQVESANSFDAAASASRSTSPSTGRSLRRLLPRNRAAPCLTCGTPVCPRHRCQDFRKEKHIVICRDCSKFFSLDFLVDATDDDRQYDERKMLMNSMLDVYDRALIILRYSSQYIDEISEALEHNTRRNNKIGLGSSATGLMSGIAGVAAAATIFTPVGPPLLVASILFGGGATAASASSEAVNYYCEPNKMADRIIVLHGMVHSISRLALTGAEVAGNNTTQVSAEDAADGTKSETARSVNWTRATANALKPLTAGALSAASVVMEAREMKSTVEKIRAGSPCDKAESLRTIGKEIKNLPETSVLARECRKFFLMELSTFG